MALLLGREAEGVAETTDVNVETALVAMGDEDLQPTQGVRSLQSTKGAKRYSQYMIQGRGFHAVEGAYRWDGCQVLCYMSVC